jgi:DNA polymerase-4
MDEQQREKKHRVDLAVDDIRRRFGNDAIRRGMMLCDRALSAPDIRNDNVIHPVSYMERGDRTGADFLRNGVTAHDVQ